MLSQTKLCLRNSFPYIKAFGFFFVSPLHPFSMLCSPFIPSMLLFLLHISFHLSRILACSCSRFLHLFSLFRNLFCTYFAGMLPFQECGHSPFDFYEAFHMCVWDLYSVYSLFQMNHFICDTHIRKSKTTRAHITQHKYDSNQRIRP